MREPRPVSDVPEAIRPVIDPAGVNESVRLFAGEMLVRAGDQEQTLQGTIELAWLPSANVRFTGEISTSPWFGFSGPAEIEIDGWLPPTPCRITSLSVLDETKQRIQGIVSEGPTRGDSEALVNEIRFVLVNFGIYRGTCIRFGQQIEVAWGRLSFRMGPWQVTVDQVRTYDEVSEALRLEGGFGVTHAGRLERADGATFTAASAASVLNGLKFWFGFLLGGWCGPVTPTAFDGLQLAWQSLDLPPLTRDRVSGWFPRHSEPNLDHAAGRFLALWNDPDWKGPLRHTVGWYVLSNASRSIETKIVMSQVALELIGWMTLVETTGALSAGGFKKLDAADKLRILCNSLRIPTDIPRRLAELGSWAKGENAVDGPEAIAQMRNAMVHPSRKKREKVGRASHDALREATELAVHYLELALLAVIGYSGRYFDRTRLFAGSADPGDHMVPWGTPHERGAGR